MDCFFKNDYYVKIKRMLMAFPAGNILIPFDKSPAIDKEKICY